MKLHRLKSGQVIRHLGASLLGISFGAFLALKHGSIMADIGPWLTVLGALLLLISLDFKKAAP